MDDPKLLSALHAADAAGDTAGATAIANHIKALRQSPQTGTTLSDLVTGGGSPAPAQATPPEGFLKADGSSPLLDRIQYGLANVGIKGYLGAKNLFGELSPEEKQVLAMSNSDVDHSGVAGHVANVVGNVGAGVAASVLTPAMAGPAALARAMPYLKAAGGSGAMAFATEPVEGHDLGEIYANKAEEAGKSALLGAGITGVAKGVTKAGTGLFQATKDAMDLYKQGINPTLQQASEGSVGRFIGGLTSGFTRTKERLAGETADALTDRISGGAVSAPGATVGQRLGMLDSGINTDYDNILGNRLFPITNNTRQAMLQQADNVGQSGGRFANQVSDARQALDNIVGGDTHTAQITADQMRGEYLNPLQTAINDSKDPKVIEALVNAKNVLTNRARNSQLSPDELQQLSDIDSRYFDLMRLKSAGDINKTGVDVNALSNAYQKAPGMDNMGATNATNEELIGPLVRTLGRTPRQDEARTALINAGRAAALVGAGHVLGPGSLAVAPLYGLSALGQTAGGARFLAGANPWQQSLRDALESPTTSSPTMANLLRTLRDNSSNLGASINAAQ